MGEAGFVEKKLRSGEGWTQASGSCSRAKPSRNEGLEIRRT